VEHCDLLRSFLTPTVTAVYYCDPLIVEMEGSAGSRTDICAGTWKGFFHVQLHFFKENLTLKDEHLEPILIS